MSSTSPRNPMIMVAGTLPEGSGDRTPEYKRPWRAAMRLGQPDIFNLRVQDLNHEDPPIFCSVDGDLPLYTGIGFLGARMTIHANTQNCVWIDPRRGYHRSDRWCTKQWIQRKASMEPVIRESELAIFRFTCESAWKQCVKLIREGKLRVIEDTMLYEVLW